MPVAAAGCSTSVTYASMVWLPGRHGDRDPVMAVLHEVQVTDPVHLDRRDRLTAPLGQRQPLPALPHPPARRPEPPVEVAGRVDRADDRVKPDRVQPEPALAALAERASTSSSGRITFTSSGARRSRRTSRASCWRRRTRRKSSATSARGNPVSAGTVTAAPRSSRRSFWRWRPGAGRPGAGHPGRPGARGPARHQRRAVSRTSRPRSRAPPRSGRCPPGSRRHRQAG